MKVLMFGWEFPPYISGGLGTACYGITKGLVENDVDVAFVVPSAKGSTNNGRFRLITAEDALKRNRSIPGKTSHSRTRRTQVYASRSMISPYHTSESIYSVSSDSSSSRTSARGSPGYGSVLDFSGNYGRNLYKEVHDYCLIGEILAEDEEFDVIHAHDWLTFPVGMTAREVSGKPLVVHVHATEFDRNGENINQEIYRIERAGMEAADKVIAVSQMVKNTITQRYGIPPEKVDVVHNAVSRETKIGKNSVRKSLKEKIVLFMGRITMQKGPEYFLEAARLVLAKDRNVRFVMAGSGDMMQRMIVQMAKHRIADRFHFTGFLRGADVERMYAQSDLYVMPSVSEPFGISAFEACLYDIPIIISRQSGVSEVMKNAVTVDFWDVQKLAAVMLAILSNETFASEIVGKCRLQMRDISWNMAGNRIKQVYSSVC